MSKVLLRYLTIFIVLVVALGCSDGSEESKSEFDWMKMFEKSQKVKINDLHDYSQSISITENADIITFVENIEIDTWILTNSQEREDKAREIYLYQEATTRFFFSKGKMKEVAVITTYNEIPYIDLQISNWTMSFKVPQHVMEFLNQY